MTTGLWVCPLVFPPCLLHKPFSEGFQPSAVPSAFSLITCTDHFHESGLSHLHRWEGRAANPSTVFLQSFQIHCVPCRRLISCASERRTGQHRERTLESGRVGSSPHCTSQHALWLGQVHTSVSAGAGGLTELTARGPDKASRTCCGTGLGRVLGHHEHLVNGR